MKHDVKPNHSQVKPKLINFATELFLCKRWIFLSLGNKLVKRTNESLKFLFVFWRKSIFLKISKLLQQHFLPTWTRLFSNHDGNYIGICHVLLWIKRVAFTFNVILFTEHHSTLHGMSNRDHYRAVQWNSLGPGFYLKIDFFIHVFLFVTMGLDLILCWKSHDYQKVILLNLKMF